MFSKYSFSWYNSFIVTKVLGTFASECYTERKFLEPSLPRNDSSTGAKVPRSECSMERKFYESKSSLWGLFAPGNESAEERKGLESFGQVYSHILPIALRIGSYAQRIVPIALRIWWSSAASSCEGQKIRKDYEMCTAMKILGFMGYQTRLKGTPIFWVIYAENGV